MRFLTIPYWLVMSVLCLTLVVLPERAADHVKAMLRDGFSPLSGFVRRIGFGSFTSATEERALHQALSTLRFQGQSAEALRRENDSLRRQLGFSRRSEHTLISCEVLARAMHSWWQTLRVDRGEADRVRESRAVVSAAGVIGKTISVSTHTAEVLLLSDPSSSVSAVIRRSNAFGILQGQGVSLNGRVRLKMTFVDKDAEIRIGDEVETTGLGGVFPGRLRLGAVVAVDQAAGGLYQMVQVKPYADLGAVRYAFIVEPSGRNLPARTPLPHQEAQT